MKARVLAAAVIAASLTAAACQSSPDPAVGQPAPGGGVVYADADVAGILRTVNTGQISLAELAADRAENQSVRDFAQSMVTDHTMANEQLAELTASNNITPSQPELARQLESGADDTADALSTLEGVAFDRTYIENQIAMHEWVLETIDNVLIPAARDQDLDNLILNIRPKIAEHLQMARQIQTDLGQ